MPKKKKLQPTTLHRFQQKGFFATQRIKQKREGVKVDKTPQLINQYQRKQTQQGKGKKHQPIFF